MILSEPPRSAYDVHFRVFGTPVRIHPMFWVMSICMAGFDSRPSQVVLWTIAALISITVHELGHVWAFRRYGIESHIVLHAFGGLAIPTGRSDYGWSSRGRLGPMQNIVVSFAGPALEVLSAVALMGVLFACGARFEFIYDGLLKFLPAVFIGSSIYLIQFINDYILLSIFWGLLNLLPIIPLDGGRISQVMFEQADERSGTRQALYVSMIAAGLTGALMFVEFKSVFSVIFFGYLAFMNYQTLTFIGSNGRRW